MKVLKNLLQYNKFLLFIGLLALIFVVIKTILIKYDTSITGNTFTGKILSYKFKDDKLVLEIKGEEKIIANYYYQDDKDSIINYIHLGDTITIEGSYKVPDNNTIPNTFNYKKYLYNKSIYTIWTIKSFRIEKDNNFIYKIKDYFYKKAYYMPNNDYYLALVLGDKSLLSDDEYHNLQVNGINHLFAISGMHISIIVWILNKLLNRFKYKNFIIIITLLFLTFILSISASILRTVIYFIISLINKKKNLYYNPIQLLFITVYIVIAINPFMVYDVGFIYSFLITFGIMYYQKYLNGNYYLKLLKISIIAFLFSLPITALLNYEINVMSILNNIVLVPFMSFILFPLTLLSFFITFLNPFYSLIIALFNNINIILININISLIIPKMPLIILAFYYFVLLINVNNRYILLLLLLIINSLLPFLDSSNYIYFFDVKQGDSALIIGKNLKDITLIDTGGLYNTDYQIKGIITFLKSNGVSTINTLVLTHGDFDHMGEAINLVNNFKVEKVIFNCGEFNDLEKELIKVLDKKKINYYSCIKELNIDKNKLYFLQTKEYNNENDNSNVIYTKLNGYKFMFMGDASITTEKEIMNKYNLSDIDVLKVGHHGSKTSSSKEFIDEIGPKYSVISVGKNNRYGHPNKEVLDNLEDSKIYRTDEDGSIMFKIKNNKIKIETCAP